MGEGDEEQGIRDGLKSFIPEIPVPPGSSMPGGDLMSPEEREAILQGPIPEENHEAEKPAPSALMKKPAAELVKYQKRREVITMVQEDEAKKYPVLVTVLSAVIAVLLLAIVGTGAVVYGRMSGTTFDNKTFSAAEKFFLGGKVQSPKRKLVERGLDTKGIHYIKLKNELPDGMTIQAFVEEVNEKGDNEKLYLGDALSFGEDLVFPCSGRLGVNFWVEVSDESGLVKELVKPIRYVSDSDLGKGSKNDPYVWVIQGLKQKSS